MFNIIVFTFFLQTTKIEDRGIQNFELRGHHSCTEAGFFVQVNKSLYLSMYWILLLSYLFLVAFYFKMSSLMSCLPLLKVCLNKTQDILLK